MEQISLWTAFNDASFVVKGVMLILISASLFSWTVILHRGYYLKRLKEKVYRFENQFWSGVNLTKLYTSLNDKSIEEGMSGIFYSGFKEYVRLTKQPGTKNRETIDAVQRAMRIAQQRDLNRVENHLPILASLGSVSPYIGLFGTVWGMMVAMHALGNVEHATISMVAPGISEALIATALGLFVAIPAVLAYNRFTNEAEKLANQYDIFREEFINILQHQLGK